MKYVPTVIPQQLDSRNLSTQASPSGDHGCALISVHSIETKKLKGLDNFATLWRVTAMREEPHVKIHCACCDSLSHNRFTAFKH